MKSQPPTPTGSMDEKKSLTQEERWRTLLASITPLERLRVALGVQTLPEPIEPPKTAREVMEKRAEDLAKVPVRAPHATEVLELVSFSLANERYAFETRHIREVIRFTDFTPIPGAPDFLVGLLNLRGEILAVFDLRKFFGVADKGVTDLSRAIVLGGDRAEFGVLADTASEVMTVRTEEVFESPGSVAGIGREYLRGVTKDGLIVLDGGVLLQAVRFFIDQGDESAG